MNGIWSNELLDEDKLEQGQHRFRGSRTEICGHKVSPHISNQKNQKNIPKTMLLR